MRKYWPYAPYTQPYLHDRQDTAVKAGDRELLCKLLCVVIVVVLFMIAVMFYRHLQGWQVIQS